VKTAALLAAVLLAGCDWTEAAFLNSLPTAGNKSGDFYVYLGVDGLSPRTVREAMAQGAFQRPDWKVAKFITMFPGTSDASWTRILHTAKTEGYEFEYYDPTTDSVINSGLLGVGRHLMPTVSESLSFDAAYLAAFDYRSNGYAHGLEAYRDPWVSIGDSLDDLFFTLEGRIGTEDAFTGYMLESDVLGHTATPADCAQLLGMLASRIEQFRASHESRNFHFTLLSDHGMDFTGIPPERLLDLNDELPKVGVVPVRSLGGRDPKQEVYAVPIVHTRVTYLAMHTHPDLIAEVGLRTSRLESVDFVAGRLGPTRYGLWSGGKLAVSFEYLPESSSYLADGDLARFGIDPRLVQGVSDQDLFNLTKDAKYPDLFYRVRTSLSDTSVEYPADLLVSFRTGWGSVGFRLPGGVGEFSGGSHGSADDLAYGVLISDERDLPDAVRADSFLSLFPRAAEHLRGRGLDLLEGDPDAARSLP